MRRGGGEEGRSELELQTIPSTFVLAEINEISRRIIWEGSHSLKRPRNTIFLRSRKFFDKLGNRKSSKNHENHHPQDPGPGPSSSP